MIGEIALILALILLNGALALSELAIVSSRPARLRTHESKSRGARMALALLDDPGRFLSSVQTGITAVGILSGALAGDTLGVRLAGWLLAQGFDEAMAARLGMGVTVVAITYVTLIVGELVPKQLALRNPEAFAMRIAPAMVVLSHAGAPVVWFLDHSAEAVLWLLGQRGEGGAQVTEEEVHVLLAEAQEGGVLEDEERTMMTGVMRLSDRMARNLMTPRRDVESLPLSATPAEAVAAVERIARPRIPVVDEAGDVVGIVLMADVFRVLAHGAELDLHALVQEVPVVSDRMEALDVIEVLQHADHRMALVYDEYGHFDGIITTGDILEAITGAEAAHEGTEPAVFLRDDGSLLVAGWMPADEFCDRMGFPREAAGDYDTVAGLVLHQLGRMPKLGDVVAVEGHRFEVVDMDGLRIDKVLVTPV